MSVSSLVSLSFKSLESPAFASIDLYVLFIVVLSRHGWPYQGCRSVSSPAWTWRWWHRVPGLTSSHPTRRIPQSVEHTRTSGLEAGGLEQREDVTLIRMSCIMWFPMSPMTLAVTWHFVTNTDFYCAELFLTFRSGRVPSTNVIWLWIFLLTEGKKDYFWRTLWHWPWDSMLVLLASNYDCVCSLSRG